MSRPRTAAELDALREEEARKKAEEKEAKRVAAQQERKKARELRAAAKKVASEVAKRPDPTPQPAPSVAPASSAPRSQAVEEAYALPYEPPSYHFGPNDDPYAELAQRELCRRKILPFIQRFRPKYTAGWVHEDICRRVERFVEQVEKGLSPRLLLLCPPRTGKSEIGSRHVAPWALGKHPEWEIIATSNSASLSLSFSRYIRDLMRDPGYQSVFPDAKLDPSSQSVENWNLTKGGGYMAAGVGTGIVGRGAHCFVANTKVRTTSGYVKIEDIEIGTKVLSYDHEAGELSEQRVIATKTSVRKDIVKVRTVSGRELVCTGDHPFYVVEKGYTQAGQLAQGDRLLGCHMPGLRASEAAWVEDVSPMLLKGAATHSAVGLQKLWGSLRAAAVRACEVAKAWAQGPLLLKTVFGSAPRGKKLEGVPSMQKACVERREMSQRDILLGRVQAHGSVSEVCAQKESVCILRQDVQAKSHEAGALFGAVRIGDTPQADARKKQLELSRGGSLPRAVLQNAGGCAGEGRVCLPHMRCEGGVGCSSHRHGSSEQYADEFGDVMPVVPQHLAQGTFEDSVECVLEVHSDGVEVYDIQVEKHRNFFAEDLLVHNCLIVDDVVRDMEAADSPTIRENIWEWYLSVAYTRLAPGGGVLGILTWWNEDDWAGRIIKAMESGEGDKFEIVKYPAINDIGDEYILPDDTMVQIAPGDPPPPPGSRMTRPKDTAIHPERYTTQMMLNIKRNFIAGGQKRIWDALYQQNPTPDDGNYFTKDMFRYYGSPPASSEMYVYQAWDFAISEGKDSDYTVGTCIGVDHRDNVYVLDVMRFRSSDGGHIIDTILDFAAQYDADCLGFEDGQIWKAIEFQFKKRCEERRQFPSHELLRPLTDKMVRANPLRGRMQLGKVYFDEKAAWYSDFYREMIIFPAGKHDDCVDSLAWAIRLTLSRAAPQQQRTQPKVKSWKGKLRGSSRGGSHMAA